MKLNIPVVGNGVQPEITFDSRNSAIVCVHCGKNPTYTPCMQSDGAEFIRWLWGNVPGGFVDGMKAEIKRRDPSWFRG